MSEAIYALCIMEVVNAFYDEVKEKIQDAMRRSNNNRISVDLTAYALYCMTLLQNNGWDVRQHLEEVNEFMWRAGPSLALYEFGCCVSRVTWDFANATLKCIIHFDQNARNYV